MINADFFMGPRSKAIEKKAARLGLFVYFLKQVSGAEEAKKIKNSEDYDGILLDISSQEMFYRIISIIGNKIIVFLGNPKLNRIALESNKIKFLLNPHLGAVDTIQYRNSGLNQVLCKIAAKNNVIVAFSLDEMKNKEAAGKIIQNLKLCEKYKVKVAIINSCSTSFFELGDVYNSISQKLELN